MVASLLAAAGCAVHALPVCGTASDLRRWDGHRIRLVGVYEAFAVPVRKRDPPQHLGHAAVVVGEVAVRIGRLPRPLEELVRFQGRRVGVEGVLRLRPPLEYPPHVAQPLPPPTLFEPGEVALAE
jgi:hypothetical protein